MNMKSAVWKEVHRELSRLARSKGAYDAEEARWLLEGKRVRVHEPLGFGSFLEYLERLFGYAPRLAQERLRVAEAMESLTGLRDELASGALSWSAVRELSRVAVPATEAEWIAAARGKTVRQVEEMVSGRRAGDRPSDPADPDARRHILRLEISADAMAAFREARRRIELDVGHALDDDEAVRMLAHYALGGPDEPGRAAYQVAMTVCERCGAGSRDGAGQVFAVDPPQVEAALCDAQTFCAHVGADKPATQEIPPRIRRLVWRRDHGRCRVPGCRASKYLEIHHVVPRSEGGTHDPSLLCLLCSAHHNQVHRDHLRLTGTAPDRLEFRHADGRRYGEPRIPTGERQDGTIEREAEDALRRLGVRPGDARAAVAEAVRQGATGLEDVLRQALRRLAATTYASRVSAVTTCQAPATAP
jgi:5-methylcytosine-specific restriction endonuclease McrA